MHRNYLAYLFVFLFFIKNHPFQAQKPEKEHCNLKSLSKLMYEVKAGDSKENLDKLFKVKGQTISESIVNDTSINKIKYQFCNNHIENTIFAVFKNNSLVNINKSFGNENCFKDEQGGFTFNKNSTYKEIKKLFGIEGDLKAIYWNNKEEVQREYVWMTCKSKTVYYVVIFRNGLFERCNKFPVQPDYSRPNNGKK